MKENWTIGKTGESVVSDHIPELMKNGDWDYYGGFLVCESVLRKSHIRIISAAPDMLEALQNIENDDGKIPDKVWKMRNDAIKKALGDIK